MEINFKKLGGFIKDDKHYYPFQVFYEDTDAGEIVYHSNYLKYFERARSSLLNLLEISQINLKERDDITLVVRKADINWYKPAKLNDNLYIETCLKYAKNSSITINQMAYRYKNDSKKNELLVSGIIQIVAINSVFKVKKISSVLNYNFFKNKL